jgi:hypothetical protein
MLAPNLKQSLKQLRDVPVEYSEQHRGFVFSHSATDRAPKRGLTTVLREVFPVPMTDRDESDTLTRKPAKRARRSTNDPQPRRTLWRRTNRRTPSAETCRDATLRANVDGVLATFGSEGFGPNFAVRHGKLVDQQLKYIVKHGYSAAHAAEMLLDPCVATLRDYFVESGLAMIASQVPLYSTDLDIATALDVLCTDSATKSQLHLCEVKAATTDCADDANYVRVRGRLKSSVARGTPLSYYVEHQLQLGVMDHMIDETLRVRPNSSRVLRVSPNCVSVYELTPWFDATSKKLLPVIKRRAARGAKRRAKRTRERQMLTK